MTALAEGKVMDSVVRELFLGQLPSSTADILSIFETKDLFSLAVSADKIYNCEAQHKSVTAAASSTE